jgi:hypothetical protein
MPLPPQPIPAGVALVDLKTGAPTVYFRLFLQQLLNAIVTDLASLSFAGQTASIAVTTAFVPATAGLYRISYYLAKTVADGVSSSLTFEYGWTDHGAARTESEAALTTDTVGAEQSGSKVVYSDANAPLQYAVTYASHTAAKMTYNVWVTVEAF